MESRLWNFKLLHKPILMLAFKCRFFLLVSQILSLKILPENLSLLKYFNSRHIQVWKFCGSKTSLIVRVSVSSDLETYMNIHLTLLNTMWAIVLCKALINEIKLIMGHFIRRFLYLNKKKTILKNDLVFRNGLQREIK